MLTACQKQYRANAVKVLVLVTDEPALGAAGGTNRVHAALTQLDAACFTVAPDLDYYRSWAHKHGGVWRQVDTSVDTSAIMTLFKSLLAAIAEVADKVLRLGGGSVQGYLER
jgi:hypothetical protein